MVRTPTRYLTDPQARRIALVWSGGTFSGRTGLRVSVKGGRSGNPPYNDPTTLALVKRGLLVQAVPVESGENPDGSIWHWYVLGDRALNELEAYLKSKRKLK